MGLVFVQQVRAKNHKVPDQGLEVQPRVLSTNSKDAGINADIASQPSVRLPGVQEF